jgi:hypothetical protein
MDDAKFDRLAQALSTILTRRRTMAIAGAAAGIMGQRAARAFQLVPATCGEEGAVCTLVAGCCDGLTCVTSAINTSFGVCVPGEGGMVSSGTTLISPFSESAVDEATGLLQDASTGSATDVLADREARIADARARRDAKQAARRARLDARRSANNTSNLNFHFGPRLKLELTTSTRDDGKRVDTIEATNRGDTSLVLTRIASLLATEDGTSLTTDPSKFTLDPGDSYFFVAGLTVADATNERFDWTDRAACDGSPGAGYLVEAALTVDSKNKDFEILCEKARGAGAVNTASETSRRKGKRHDQQQRKKKR